MGKGIFITGTDTDVGKTYVTALIAKHLKGQGINVGYYKAALSGAYYRGEQLIPGDAKEVLEAGEIDEAYEHCVSYTFEEAVSPHLAASRKNVKIDLDKILEDYNYIKNKYECVLVEGSGGIICPIKREGDRIVLLEDIIKLLDLDVIMVARAGLGTINHTVLTVKYLEQVGISLKGIIINEYEENNFMHEDNKEMIKQLTRVPIIGIVPKEGICNKTLNETSNNTSNNTLSNTLSNTYRNMCSTIYSLCK